MRTHTYYIRINRIFDSIFALLHVFISIYYNYLMYDYKYSLRNPNNIDVELLQNTKIFILAGSQDQFSAEELQCIKVSVISVLCTTFLDLISKF